MGGHHLFKDILFGNVSIYAFGGNKRCFAQISLIKPLR
jgi:hypothetical protein